MALRRVLAASDLRPGEMRGVLVDGQRVVVVHCDGQLRAFADRCAHRDAPLSAGTLEACVLTCNRHDWRYDARTGEGIEPKAARLVAYRLEVHGDDVLVDVAPSSEDRAWVGPVLQTSEAAASLISALLAALAEENPDARILSRGTEVRVLALRRCRLSRAAVERFANRTIGFPADLERVMSSFEGHFTVTDDEATWEAAAET